MDEYGKAETTGNDGQADGDQDVRVFAETDEVVTVEREPGVVEGGYRVEDAMPQRNRWVGVVDEPEPDSQDCSRYRFKNDHDPCNAKEHGADVPEVEGVRF